MFRVTVERGEPAGAVFELQPGENIAGRSHSANLRVATADVSGRHLCLRLEAGTVTAENLSRGGSLLDGVPLAAPTPLRSGQRLQLGANTVLLVEELAPAKVTPVADSATQPPATATAAAEPPTGIGAATPPPPPPKAVAAPAAAAAPDLERTAARPAAPPAPGAEATNVLAKTVAARQAAEGPEGGTRIMQTRVASTEEIEFLKEAERKRSRNRILLMVGGGLFLLLLVFLLWPRRPAPEPSLTWPKDAKGDWLDAFVKPASGGYDAGGFDLAFPGAPGWTSKPIPGGIEILTRVGRDQDVPLRLILEEVDDPKEVERTRLATLDEWMRTARESGGSWNFDPPSAVFFIGGDNGIPCVAVAYVREKGEPWFGVATLFRHGLRRVVLRAEVPAAERVRAEAIVNSLFLKVSPPFVSRHWEGAPELPAAEAGDLISQVRLELARMAPSAWDKLDVMLMGTLRKAVRNGNREQEQAALELLQDLRQKQMLWFNAQRIAYFNALAQNDRKTAARIAEVCKAVFSSPDDARYYAIRKNEW
ncbi:MAG: FHA domain-containing protein [Lentisphaeria bacterium]|jgi:pSer/pThr/pTyr-binding forkhead associated (FHA) protein